MIRPRALTPVDAEMQAAMKRSRLRLHPDPGLWDVWVGFNWSHSLGLITYGGAVVYLASRHFGMYASEGWLRTAVVAVVAVYVGLAFRFWFRIPALGTSAGLTLLASASLTLPR